MSASRPYRHTRTEATESGAWLVVLGTYATIGAAVRAAKKADAPLPDETREIRRGNRSLRNRYTHGPVVQWRET